MRLVFAICIALVATSAATAETARAEGACIVIDPDMAPFVWVNPSECGPIPPESPDLEP